MRILLVSQYFWPETFIINELVTCLTEQGHTIEVLTGKPNYPEGKVYDGYKAKGCMTDVFNATTPVHRVPVYPRGQGGARRLLLNYLSFVISGLYNFHQFVKKKEFDVIFVFAPSPVTSVIPAMYLKKRLKVPLAVWVQDLWPESLSATGFVKNKRLLSLTGKMVRWIYNSTDALLVQSKAFQKQISQYAHEEKITYYPNSYLENKSALMSDQLLPDELLSLLKNYQCFVFAGNLGTAQAVEILVEAALQLKHLPDCRLVLVGSGSKSEWLKQQIAEKQLDNLILAGRFSPDLMPQLFAEAVALLVTLKRDEIFSYTIPSKVQAYLAAGRPIIAALDGEGARIIDEAGAGFASSAENGVLFAKNIEQVYYMSAPKRDTLGQSGRAYFLRYFEMVSQSKHLIEILEEKISKRRQFE